MKREALTTWANSVAMATAEASWPTARTRSFRMGSGWEIFEDRNVLLHLVQLLSLRV